jgi:putative holliday junction resolvase
MNRIVGLVREHAVKQVVVGLPVGLSGADTQQTMAARDFADRLGKRVRVPVDLYDERFTTSIAAARGGAGSEDSRAAAVMLEDYLARHA